MKREREREREIRKFVPTEHQDLVAAHEFLVPAEQKRRGAWVPRDSARENLINENDDSRCAESARARGSSLSPRNIKTWLGAGSCGERNFGRAALRSAPILIVRVIRAGSSGRERKEKKRDDQEIVTEGSKEGRKERRKAQVGKDRDATVGNLDSLRFRVKKFPRNYREGARVASTGRKRWRRERWFLTEEIFSPRLNIVSADHIRS